MGVSGPSLLIEPTDSMIPYSRKIWRGIKFGGELNLAVWRSTFATAKLKCANIHTCIYTYGDPVPNHQI